MRFFAQAAFLTGLLTFNPISAALAESNLLIILDASGSMWGKVNGAVKMDTAKDAVGELLGDLAEDTKVGLMVYGHRVKGDCKDVETLSGIGNETRAAIAAKAIAVTPLGKTPIAYSLQSSAANFDGRETANNNLFLISDGIESCDGDPCTVAKALASKGIGLKIHVVGFNVDDQTRAQLECIAENGKGKYFDAKDTASFKQAFAEVQQMAQATPEPAPEPAGPKLTEVFRDDFDGDDLADHWEVQNPTPDAYVVENGNLLMLSSSVTGFNHKNMPNMITLNYDLPRGDWDVKLTFSGELAVGFESLWLGLRKDEKNFLSSMILNNRHGNDSYRTIMLRITKHASGKETKADSMIWKHGDFGLDHDSTMKKFAEGPAVLTLTKRGRSYSAAFQIAGMPPKSEQPQVIQTSKLTSLRTPGELTLGVGLWKQADGEFLSLIDSIEIIKVEK